MTTLRQPALHDLIEAAYVLFAPYTLGATFCVCKACCVSDAQEQALLRTPLRHVSWQVLSDGLFVLAQDHSDQERWEMKHFLPRVLELATQFEFPVHSVEITFSRLDLDQPAHWPAAERQLLATFARTYFEACLTLNPLPEGNQLTDILLMFGLAHFELTPLLHSWATANSPTSLAHLADLLLDELDDTPPKALKLRNPFSTPHVDQQLRAWLSDQDVRATLVAQVEQALLHQQVPDEEATRLSWAYDVLTHGLSPTQPIASATVPPNQKGG
ncbi:hypothetical protein [Hymenobacter bucti]|uniref:Uncharacterized protein n=1 Tax=Hymenobacter bucti TaxID=1844114 RepID=A0ABW4R1J5_9BACT